MRRSSLSAETLLPPTRSSRVGDATGGGSASDKGSAVDGSAGSACDATQPSTAAVGDVQLGAGTVLSATLTSPTHNSPPLHPPKPLPATTYRLGSAT